MEQNCCFNTEDNKRYRFRAAAIIVEDGHVLMATNSKAGYYYSIGGGVHLGELAQDAAQREAFEETGVNYEVDRLLVIHENFFKDKSQSVLNKYFCHELSFYYLMKPRGTRQLPVHKSRCIDGEETVAWLPINQYSSFKAYPTFFADILNNIPDGIQHIITKEIEF